MISLPDSAWGDSSHLVSALAHITDFKFPDYGLGHKDMTGSIDKTRRPWRVPIYTVREGGAEESGKKEPAQGEGLTSALLDFSLADAREQLNVLESQVRDRLFSEYVSQCADIAPYLRTRGRSVGSKLLNALLVAQDPPAYGDVSDEEDTSTDSDQLAGVDPFLKPVLDPFVEGLTEPFTQQYSKIQTRVVLALVASSAGCLVAGFFLGRHFGGGKKD